MRQHLFSWLLAGILATAVSGCDNSNNSTSTPANAAPTNHTSANASHDRPTASSQQISLPDGQLNFTLPADMTDQTGKIGKQDTLLHIYANHDGSKVIIVIVSDDTADSLATMASRLETQQRQRDPQLQVITSQPIHITGHELWQFESVITTDGQVNYSNILFGKLNHQLLTLQISLPDGDQGDHRQPQQAIQDIISSLQIK